MFKFSQELKNGNGMVDSDGEGISANSGKGALQHLVDDILFKIRYLRRDVQTVERAADLMEEVGMLYKTLRVFLYW